MGYKENKESVGSKLGEVTLVKDCMICRREVILMATRSSNKPLPEKGTTLPQVCKECGDKYLKAGVLLINPDNGGFVVIKDEAFERIFSSPIPKGKIAFTDDEVLKKLQGGK